MMNSFKIMDSGHSTEKKTYFEKIAIWPKTAVGATKLAIFKGPLKVGMHAIPIFWGDMNQKIHQI